MLSGKKVVVAVTGSIAAYKALDIVSKLKKLNAEVFVIMTENATKFVSPLSFETLSKNKVSVKMFENTDPKIVEHIELAKNADAFVIAPASANVIAKITYGIADDMLTSTYLANKSPVIIAPSMNVNMYESVTVRENLKTLESRGATIIDAATGMLACGDVGKGKLANVDDIVEKIKTTLLKTDELKGKRVLITLGGTYEKIDKVRYIGNFSSGKMGKALIEEALLRGADVTAVVGRISVDLPKGIEVKNVGSTGEMLDAVLENLEKCDIVIKSAAPCDYTVKNYKDEKIKAESLSLELKKTSDIAKEVGKIKGNKKLVIFSAETSNLYENSYKKLQNKNADLVVANDVTKAGAGFQTDTNIATIIDKNGNKRECEMMQKTALAKIIFDEINKLV